MKKILFILLSLFLSVNLYAQTDFIDGHQYNNFEVTEWHGMGAPAVSATDEASVYFDSALDYLMLSENGGAYSHILSGSTASGLYLLLDCSNDPLTGDLLLQQVATTSLILSSNDGGTGGENTLLDFLETDTTPAFGTASNWGFRLQYDPDTNKFYIKSGTHAAVKTIVEIAREGDIKIQPDVQGDILFFGDTDVGDDADGKSLYIYRKAEEEDSEIRAYIDADHMSHIISDENFAIHTSVDNLFLYSSGGQVLLQPYANGDVELFSVTDVADDADGKSFYIHRKAAEGDDYFQIYGDDDSVTGMITYSGGTISFDDENLKTTGSFSVPYLIDVLSITAPSTSDIQIIYDDGYFLRTRALRPETDATYDVGYEGATDWRYRNGVFSGKGTFGSFAFGAGQTVDTIETTVTDDDTHLPTSGAVYDAIEAENFWDRAGTVLSPHNAGDDVELGTSSYLFAGYDSKFYSANSSLEFVEQAHPQLGMDVPTIIVTDADSDDMMVVEGKIHTLYDFTTAFDLGAPIRMNVGFASILTNNFDYDYANTYLLYFANYMAPTRTGTMSSYGAGNAEMSYALNVSPTNDAVFAGSEDLGLTETAIYVAPAVEFELNAVGTTLTNIETCFSADLINTATETAGTLVSLNFLFGGQLDTSGMTVTSGSVTNAGLYLHNFVVGGSDTTWGIYDTTSHDWRLESVDKYIQFYDSGIKIGAGADSYFDIHADGAIRLHTHDANKYLEMDYLTSATVGYSAGNFPGFKIYNDDSDHPNMMLIEGNLAVEGVFDRAVTTTTPVMYGLWSFTQNTSDWSGAPNDVDLYAGGIRVESIRNGTISGYGTGCQDLVHGEYYCVTNDAIYTGANDIEVMTWGIIGDTINNLNLNSAGATIDSRTGGLVGFVENTATETAGTLNVWNAGLVTFLDTLAMGAISGTVMNAGLAMENTDWDIKAGQEANTFGIHDNTPYDWKLFSLNKYIQFYDSDVKIGADDDGYLDLFADTSIDLNSPQTYFSGNTLYQQTDSDIEERHDATYTAPSDGDVLSSYRYFGYDDDSNQLEYARIEVIAETVDIAEPWGEILFYTYDDEEAQLTDFPIHFESGGIYRVDDTTITGEVKRLNLWTAWEVEASGATNIDADVNGILMDPEFIAVVEDGTLSSSPVGLYLTPDFDLTETGAGSVTGGYTALKVNVIETNVGSDTKYLMDLQIGGTSHFNVQSDKTEIKPTSTEYMTVSTVTIGGLGAVPVISFTSTNFAAGTYWGGFYDALVILENNQLGQLLFVNSDASDTVALFHDDTNTEIYTDCSFKVDGVSKTTGGFMDTRTTNDVDLQIVGMINSANDGIFFQDPSAPVGSLMKFRIDNSDIITLQKGTTNNVINIVGNTYVDRLLFSDDLTIWGDTTNGYIKLDANSNTSCIRLTATDSANDYADFYVDSDGDLHIIPNGVNIIIGNGVADVDYSIYFYGETNQLYLTYDEDNDMLISDGKFKSDDYYSGDGTQGATADVGVAKVGGGTRTLHFKDGLYTSFTDS